MHDSKKQYARLILALAEDVSETPEKAADYLRSRGIDPDEGVRDGIERIKKIMAKITTESQRATNLKMKISAAIFEEMEKRKISKEALATKMNVELIYIDQLLSGTENLTLEMIATVETALGAKIFRSPLKRRASSKNQQNK